MYVPILQLFARKNLFLLVIWVIWIFPANVFAQDCADEEQRMVDLFMSTNALTPVISQNIERAYFSCRYPSRIMKVLYFYTLSHESLIQNPRMSTNYLNYIYDNLDVLKVMDPYFPRFTDRFRYQFNQLESKVYAYNRRWKSPDSSDPWRKNDHTTSPLPPRYNDDVSLGYDMNLSEIEVQAFKNERKAMLMNAGDLMESVNNTGSIYIDTERYQKERLLTRGEQRESVGNIQIIPRIALSKENPFGEDLIISTSMPPPTDYTIMDRSLFISLEEDQYEYRNVRLGDVGNKLKNALLNANYNHIGFQSIDGGFALITEPEWINSNGEPLPEDQRWNKAVPVAENWLDRVVSYFKVYASARKGYSRAFIFFVTFRNLEPKDGEEPMGLFKKRFVGKAERGEDNVPDTIKHNEFSEKHKVTVYVYQFFTEDIGKLPVLMKSTQPSSNIRTQASISCERHLIHTGITDYLYQYKP